MGAPVSLKSVYVSYHSPLRIMSLEKPTLDEIAVSYYRKHRPEKNIVRAGLNAWRPILIEMIEEYRTLDDIHVWMTGHHENLKLKLPAKITVRDWLTRVRREINKPLRQRKQENQPTTISGQKKPAKAEDREKPGSNPEDEKPGKPQSTAEEMEELAANLKSGKIKIQSKSKKEIYVSRPKSTIKQ